MSKIWAKKQLDNSNEVSFDLLSPGDSKYSECLEKF